MRHDRIGADNGPLANPDAGKHDSIRTQPYIILNPDRRRFASLRGYKIMRTVFVVVVGNEAARRDQNMIPQRQAVRNIKFRTIADKYLITQSHPGVVAGDLYEDLMLELNPFTGEQAPRPLDSTTLPDACFATQISPAQSPPDGAQSFVQQCPMVAKLPFKACEHHASAGRMPVTINWCVSRRPSQGMPTIILSSTLNIAEGTKP